MAIFSTEENRDNIKVGLGYLCYEDGWWLRTVFDGGFRC
jgi:hypothetical protein